MGLTSLEDTLKGKLKVRKNAHIMLVDGMSKLTTHKVNLCQSSVFRIDDLEWKLIVHPAGKDGTKDYLSVYLRVKDKKSLHSDWDGKCHVKLILVSQTASDGCKSWERDVCYKAKNAIHGAENFMWHQELKDITMGYLVNDKAVFCAEVTKFGTTIPRAIGTAERLKLIDVPRSNARFTWKITQLSSFTGTYHSSYEFTVGPRRWKLMMYPKGFGDGTGNSLSLFLRANDYVTNGPKAKTLAVFKMRVLDQLRRNHFETANTRKWFGYYPNQPDSFAYGWPKLLPLDKIKDPSTGYLVDDAIYIGVDFSLVSTTEYL